MAKKVICTETECFANKCGVFCDILTEYVKHPCPFYKTREQNEEDQIAAHNRLLKLGRKDLINKFEYNAQRGDEW